MTRTTTIAVLALAATLLAGPPARAEIQSSSEGHFVSVQQVTVNAPPQRAWKALTEEISRWWSPDHTWSGNARNLSLEARPGGCFCERLPNGGVRHLEVVYVKPPELLRLEGGLGPLQEQALAGAMTWTLKPEGQGCVVTVTYRVSGWVEGGLSGWSAAVDGVLGLQIGRLKSWVDTGDPGTRP